MGAFHNWLHPCGKSGNNAPVQTYRLEAGSCRLQKTAVWDGKNLANLLTKQFGHLQKGPSGPVEPSTIAHIGKKMPVVAFYEGEPGIFGVYTDEFATNAQVIISELV